MRDKRKSGIVLIAVFALAAIAIFLLLKARADQAPQAPHQAEAQEVPFRPAIIEQPMPDFTLPAFQGGTVTLSSLRGKNVLILFPRGYAAEDYWCTICNYRYVELAQLDKALGLRRKYNVEILVVFPYGRDLVKTWIASLPEQLDKIHAAKFPEDPSKLDETARRRMERWRLIFPRDLSLEKGEMLAPFPVLIDADRTVSKSLGLFRTEWNGGKADQNIPSVFIVDPTGVLQFKYVGQVTTDRPSADYLFTVLDVINSGRRVRLD